MFVFLYSIVLVFGVIALLQGPEAWQQWLLIVQQPLFILLHLVSLAAALYHATTWFRLAPKIMTVRYKEWQLPEKTMLEGQWVAFVLITVAIMAFAILGGR